MQLIVVAVPDGHSFWFVNNIKQKVRTGKNTLTTKFWRYLTYRKVRKIQFAELGGNMKMIKVKLNYICIAWNDLLWVILIFPMDIFSKIDMW